MALRYFLSIFEWPLKTGFIIYFMYHSDKVDADQLCAYAKTVVALHCPRLLKRESMNFKFQRLEHIDITENYKWGGNVV